VAEARVSASSLNLRTGPHVSYTAVAYLMEGEQVRLVGRNRAGTWAQIELYNGYRGWVHAGYIRPTVDLAALPIVDVALWGITAFVTNDPVPVYAGPDPGYALVGRGEPGDTLGLNGRNEAATWVHVYLPDGRSGWAAADSSFLPTAAINDLPILTPFLDAPPLNLAPFFLVYAGPGFIYDPIDRVTEGQTLSILGRTDDSRWVLVRTADGREGWIAAEIIHIGAALTNVPVVTSNAPPQVVGWRPTRQPGASGQSVASATPTTTNGDSKQPTIPTAATTTEATGTAAATATATAATPTATATAQPTLTSAATATPAAGDLTPPPGIPIVYVYATPDANTEPILRVVPGQSVVLIGRTADSEWIKIWLPGGQEGWIMAEALQLDIDVEMLPIVE
jgi:uncharacterized protein YgiM (DUF1202 family)